MGLDGEAIQVEWTNSPTIYDIDYSSRDPERLEEKNIQPENFKDRVIFMSMFHDILWTSDDQTCISNAEKVKNYAKKFLTGHWIFLGPGVGEEMVW